jgi:heptosyltransferase-2
MHEVTRDLNVLRSIGGKVAEDHLELWTDEDDLQRISFLLPRENSNPLIAICPSGRYAQKRWPIARFASVIQRMLVSRPNARFILIGGQSDRALVAPLLNRFGDRLIDLTGILTLRQTAAALKRCDLYIGCDTGPMHMAAAAGAGVVEISCHPLEGDPSAEYSPLRFGPWKTRKVVLQPHIVAPCTFTCTATEAHCILGVSVDDVIDAADRLLAVPAIIQTDPLPP